MQSCRTDAEGGLNSFVEEQKKHPGEAVYTLVQFNTNYEFVHKAMPIKDVPKFTLQPSGGTALLDAIGRAIIETGDRLKAMPEDQRPGLVVFVILTDGEENSSREFTREKIKEMIEHQTTQYKWQFTYLGANQDAFAVGGSMGIPMAASAGYTTDKVSAAFAGTGGNVARMRTASATGKSVVNAYTPDEIKAMAPSSEKP